ncbi:MAG: FHA domain-containing protein [Betaproteobacteria bacterium]|nr:FHA domain-containing protein [Betaproteobacteria bacterium]
MSWVVEVLAREGHARERIRCEAAADGNTAPCRIGRALDNDVVIDDPHCAAYHARIDFLDATRARIEDLNTVNGVRNAKRKRLPVHDVINDAPFRIGQTQIRIRSTEWPVTAEKKLGPPIWPWAIAALLAVLGHEVWQEWVKHTGPQTPRYFYELSAAAAGLGAWSAMYALLGRLTTGVDRFFTHVVIAACGFLSGHFALEVLESVAFAFSWLWPVRIEQPVVVIVAALTVRAHLRLADAQHWPMARYAVVVVALTAIAVPIAQQLHTHNRWTPVQTLRETKHPALRMSSATPQDTFFADAQALKARADAERARKEEDASFDWQQEEQ